jgi:hypothetical protein
VVAANGCPTLLKLLVLVFGSSYWEPVNHLSPSEYPAPDWHVETLRASVFFAPTASIDAEVAFVSVTKEEPENVVEDRKKAMVRALGPFLGGQLEVVSSPRRLDLILSPHTAVEGSLPTFGSWEDVGPQFDEGIARVLATHPRLTRLAFGGVLLSSVADHIQGYALLNQLLPDVNVNGELSSDFQYRINRRRPFNTREGKTIPINRLTNWSVAKMQGFIFEVEVPGSPATPGVARTLTPMATNDTAFATRLEFDVNTSPEMEDLPTPELVDLWRKLVEYTFEIAQKGDIQ